MVGLQSSRIKLRQSRFQQLERRVEFFQKPDLPVFENVLFAQLGRFFQFFVIGESNPFAVGLLLMSPVLD